MTAPSDQPSDERGLSHLDAQGRAHMVNVAEKPVSPRRAVAQGRVTVNEALARAIHQNTLEKGHLLEAAKLAGIQAAKRTDELIPLCHSLPLDHVDLDARLDGLSVRLRATVTTTAKTGVEMEAFTAVTVAALTVIDMGKALDKQMTIEHIELLEKTGGASDRSAGPSP